MRVSGLVIAKVRFRDGHLNRRRAGTRAHTLWPTRPGGRMMLMIALLPLVLDLILVLLMAPGHASSPPAIGEVASVWFWFWFWL